MGHVGPHQQDCGCRGRHSKGYCEITTFVTSISDWRAHVNEQQEIFQQFFKGEYPANSLLKLALWPSLGWM
jgi:enamine deaminase RidA (YjgF/YER057c/UK114 family)